MKNGLVVGVDLSDISREFTLSKRQSEAMAKAVLDDVTALVLANWQAHAKNQLKSSRAEYLAGLKWIEDGKLKNVLMLMGQVPNMIEMGVSAFDLKKGFEASAKKTISKDGGWYLTIPFRFAVPGALGEDAAFTGSLPNDIYRALLKQEPASISSDKKTIVSKPLRGTEIKYPPKTRHEVITRTGHKFESYKHKSGIYEGITRTSKVFNSGKRSKYQTFRRVSNNSDPLSWIHTGIKAYNLAQKAIQTSDINTQVNNSVDNFLAG
jgi:hypothetical protein